MEEAVQAVKLFTQTVYLFYVEVTMHRYKLRVTLRCVIPVVCVTNEREENVAKQHN